MAAATLRVCFIDSRFLLWAVVRPEEPSVADSTVIPAGIYFWFGVILLCIGLFYTIIRANVVWYSCHSLQDGGVPTTDFIWVPPGYFAMAVWAMLHSYNAVPFIGFGWVVFGGLMVVFLGVYVLFGRHGEPERQRQLRLLLAENAQRPDNGLDDVQNRLS
jgi:hypothetical protein